jgi:hypothetical protein
MIVPVELPEGVERRDSSLKYVARKFDGELAQIEAAKHFASLALSALRFGPYGCHAGAMPTEFAASLAMKGHRARVGLTLAIKLIDEIETIEREEAAKNGK